MSTARKISQETFDEVVQENVNDFDMSKEDALAEAVKEFRIQGVDLSTIDITGGVGKDEFMQQVATLQQYVQSRKTRAVDPVTADEAAHKAPAVAALTELAKMSTDTYAHSLRNQTLLNTKGGLNVLHELLLCLGDVDILLGAVEALFVASKTNVENRDFFEPGGSRLVTKVITHYTDLVMRGDAEVEVEDDLPRKTQLLLIYNCYRLCRLASKTEYNKVMLMKAHLGEAMLHWLNCMAALLQERAVAVGTSIAPPTPSAGAAGGANSAVKTVFKAVNTNTTPTAVVPPTQTIPPRTARCGKLLSGITTEVCFAIKGCCIHDDVRKEMSCAFDNGKFFLGSDCAVIALMTLANAFKLHDLLQQDKDQAAARSGMNFVGISTSALSTVKQLITTEESVQIMALHGAMELPGAIFSGYLRDMASSSNSTDASESAAADEGDEGEVSEPRGSRSQSDANAPAGSGAINIQLLRAITGVMRNLCADDVRKNTLAGDGTLAALVAVMSRPECMQDVTFGENALGCLAMITLRSPGNAVNLVRRGVCDTVLQCMYFHMNKHRLARTTSEAAAAASSTAGAGALKVSFRAAPSPSALLRQGCLFFRNVAARCPAERAGILANTTVENVLKQVGLQYKDCVDEAYGALRDFDVDIRRVKVNEADGTVEAAYESFGSGLSSTKFNPVFDSSNDIDSRVESESRAPFQGQGNQQQQHAHGEGCSSSGCGDH